MTKINRKQIKKLPGITEASIITVLLLNPDEFLKVIVVGEIVGENEMTFSIDAAGLIVVRTVVVPIWRSEERRVGKECSS